MVDAQSFLNDVGNMEVSEADFKEMGKHCHSDLESDCDQDPYFEYNKCQKHQYLENKVNDKTQKFKDIKISRFFTKAKMEDEVPVNIADETNRLVSQKYEAAMENIVSSNQIIDQKELKAFDTYIWRNKHMTDHSGIPNHDDCWQPLPHYYFRADRADPSSKKRIQPKFTSTDYRDFSNSETAENTIQDDLLEFERYAKFDVASLESVQIREAIIEDINLATPAASYEGTLDEWADMLQGIDEEENQTWHETQLGLSKADSEEIEKLR